VVRLRIGYDFSMGGEISLGGVTMLTRVIRIPLLQHEEAGDYPMQKSRRTRGIQTRLIHSPQAANDTTAVSPPIFQTSTFLMPTPEEGAELAEQVAPAMFYTLYGSPNTKQVEVLLAKLEGSEAALAVGSGMAAITCKCLDSTIANLYNYVT
jgi:hypothetical protein